VTGTKIVGAGLILAASVCLVLGSASAQDAREQAMNNVQGEMTTCVAHFAITTQCLRLRNRPQEDAQLIQRGPAAKDTERRCER
jgi:hypothetical protein